jgi:hypothetical protein
LAIWPAGSQTARGFNPYKFTGSPALFSGHPVNKRGVFTVMPKTMAAPDGYSAGGAYVMPYTAGGMSSWQGSITLQGAGNVLAGGPMIGEGQVTFTGDGNVSLVISMSGDGGITLTGSGGVSLTIGLSGGGSWVVSGSGGLSMIIPIDGAGSFGITGAGDVKGDLAMEGSWSPFTELSPQSLATAVWSALAAQNNEPGTMGDLLNAAGGGGISGAVIEQIVDAVWERVGSNGAQYGATLTAAEKWAKLSAALSA